MSADSEIRRVPGRTRPSEVVSGYLSALAIFSAAISVAWHPLRLSPLAMLLALAGVMISALCFFLGLTVAVVTSRPLW